MHCGIESPKRRKHPFEKAVELTLFDLQEEHPEDVAFMAQVVRPSVSFHDVAHRDREKER